jgi:hypothetical protein
MFSMEEQFTVGEVCINNTTDKTVHCMVLSRLNNCIVLKKISLNPNQKSSVTSNISASIKIGQEYKKIAVWGKKIIIIVRDENDLLQKISTKRSPGLYDIAYKGEHIVIKKNECSHSPF